MITLWFETFFGTNLGDGLLTVLFGLFLIVVVGGALYLLLSVAEKR